MNKEFIYFVPAIPLHSLFIFFYVYNYFFLRYSILSNGGGVRRNAMKNEFKKIHSFIHSFILPFLSLPHSSLIKRR